MKFDVACHLNVLMPEVDFTALPNAFKELQKLGYQRVVLPPVDPEAFDTPRLAHLCALHGITAIPIAGQRPGVDVSAEDPESRKAGAIALRRMVDLTNELGGDQLNGVPYGLFERATSVQPHAAFKRSAAAVGEVAEYAYERGVTMTFEVLNRYETSLINTAEQAMEFAELSESKHLGIHLDTFHMLIEETDIETAIRTALPRLKFLELGQSSRGALTTGALDMPRIISSALDAGYNGRWGIEAFSSRLLSTPAQNALAVWRPTFTHGLSVAAGAAELFTGTPNVNTI